MLFLQAYSGKQVSKYLESWRWAHECTFWNSNTNHTATHHHHQPWTYYASILILITERPTPPVAGPVWSVASPIFSLWMIESSNQVLGCIRVPHLWYGSALLSLVAFPFSCILAACPNQVSLLCWILSTTAISSCNCHCIPSLISSLLTIPNSFCSRLIYTDKALLSSSCNQQHFHFSQQHSRTGSAKGL